MKDGTRVRIIYHHLRLRVFPEKTYLPSRMDDGVMVTRVKDGHRLHCFYDELTLEI